MARINERIALQATPIAAADFVKEVPDPSEAELLAFYEQYKNNVPGLVHMVLGAQLPAPDPGFMQPRRVKLNYILGDVNSWRDEYRDSITDEEIADYYERNKRTLFEKQGGSSKFDDSLFNSDSGDKSKEEEEEESTENTEAESSEASDEANAASQSSESANDAEDSTNEDSTDEATEEPATPEDDESSNLTSPGHIRLVAFQDTDDNSDESSDVERADNGETTDSDSSDDDNSGDASDSEDEAEYEPLEDVKDSIRDKLATDKAVVELKNKIEDIFGELQSEYNPYGFQVVSARTEEKEIPAPPKQLTNLKERAAAAGLISEETLLVTQRELADTFVGKAIDAQTKGQYVVQAAFSSLANFEPYLAQDLDGNWYLVTKIQDVPEKIPAFEDIRGEVAEAWKQQQAAKLALKKAEELASESETAG